MTEHCSPYQDLQPQDPEAKPDLITADMIDKCVITILGRDKNSPRGSTELAVNHHWEQCRKMAAMLNEMVKR